MALSAGSDPIATYELYPVYLVEMDHKHWRSFRDPGKRGAAKAGVSDAAGLAHFRDKRSLRQMRTGGAGDEMALRLCVGKCGL